MSVASLLLPVKAFQQPGCPLSTSQRTLLLLNLKALLIWGKAKNLLCPLLQWRHMS